MRSQLTTVRILYTAIFVMAIAVGLKKSKPHVERDLASIAAVSQSEGKTEIPNTSIRAGDGTEMYTFERRVTADLVSDDSKAVSPIKNMVDLAYSGRMLIEWQKKNPRMARFSFEINQPKLVSSLYVEALFDSNGKMTSFRAPLTKTPEQQEEVSFLKDLVSLYSFYSTEDTTGKYVAQFKEEKSVETDKILKQKIKYLTSLASPVELVRSKHVLWLDPKNGTVMKVEGSEETQMKSIKDSGIRTVSEYKLMKMKATAASRITQSGTLSLVDDQLTIDPSASTKKPAWSTVAPRFHAVSHLTSKEQVALFHDALKALKNDSVAIANLKDWILSHLDTASVNLGIGLLATEGSADSQKALVSLFADLLKNEATRDYCHTILSSLTTTAAILTTDSKQLLTQLMDHTATDSDLATNAAFAAGSSLKKEFDETLQSKLESVVQSASNPSDKLAMIDAIGNSGDAHFLPYLEQDLHSDNESVREKAAFALRFVQSESSKSLIEFAMNDSKLSVQIATVKAIQYHSDVQTYSSILTTCMNSPNGDAGLVALCGQVYHQAN